MSYEPARRVYRTWMMDSARWDAYRPRAGDVVITTYPKCGTTWMQQIVALLIFQTPEPRPVTEIGAWVDRRLDPIGEVMARFEAQTHRRFLKSHVPFDGLPIHDEVRYIHVARDGRDACLSYHNQVSRFRPEMRQKLNEIGRADALLRADYPAIPPEPRDFFRLWLTQGVAGGSDGCPYLSFFDFQCTYWQGRRRKNLLMVHYRDLKADLAGEMRRIARFLEIEVPDALWPSIINAATFEEMRREGANLAPRMVRLFSGGAADFFQRGENDRWQGVLTEEDLALYEQTVAARLSPANARWLRHGRLGSLDPREAADEVR